MAIAALWNYNLTNGVFTSYNPALGRWLDCQPSPTAQTDGKHACSGTTPRYGILWSVTSTTGAFAPHQLRAPPIDGQSRQRRQQQYYAPAVDKRHGTAAPAERSRRVYQGEHDWPPTQAGRPSPCRRLRWQDAIAVDQQHQRTNRSWNVSSDGSFSCPLSAPMQAGRPAISVGDSSQYRPATQNHPNPMLQEPQSKHRRLHQASYGPWPRLVGERSGGMVDGKFALEQRERQASFWSVDNSTGLFSQSGFWAIIWLDSDGYQWEWSP